MWTRRLWSDFAIGLGAVSVVEQAIVVRPQPSACGPEEMKNRQGNSASWRVSAVGRVAAISRASDSDVMNGESSADWLDVAAFRRELEGFHLRMINACLRETEGLADSMRRLSSDLSFASDASPFLVADDSCAVRRVQDAVTDAVRLLGYGADSLALRETASPSSEESMRPYLPTPIQRTRD